MGIEIFFFAVILLACFAIFDLVVGVSNDAVNFLNASIGSRVAPFYIIMIIASLGIIAGVTFSSGMMEVARKGIFHPQFFNMPNLLTIFLAVMIADVILLDIFNTFGLPTSTTVSIVFELLGAAVAVSILKIIQAHQDITVLGDYINTGKAMIIIFGILLSVVVAFIAGAIAQLLSRLLFTFDYVKRLARYGAIWGGIAMAVITYFILVKGAKGSSLITPEVTEWIKTNAVIMLLVIFGVSAVILQILLLIKVNILKLIVLVGTFALAMAFAANDLVNFIGVPMAGYHAYQEAAMAASPLTTTMDALKGKVPTQTYLLLLAGLIMVVTLWISKKARSVTETEISLGQQDEGEERFGSSFLSRSIVGLIRSFLGLLDWCCPKPLRRWAGKRLDCTLYKVETDEVKRPSFDLLRASVNLMVASAVISYATSYKLPLSTTYVTFMVAMGTSFADQAWGRESAVYRVTGVLTVVSGWFLTAFFAFTISAFFAVTIFYAGAYGVALLLLLAAVVIWKNHRRHKERIQSQDMDKVFNLKKVTNAGETFSATLKHMSYLLREIRVSLDATLEALFNQNENLLRKEMRKTDKIQRWTNIITANVFKSMRLLQQAELDLSYKYGQSVRRLQKLADGHRDMVMRSYIHISNHHKGLLDEQIEELKQVKKLLLDILLDVEKAFARKAIEDHQAITNKYQELKRLGKGFNDVQMERVRNDTSKTRLTILYYGIMGNAMMLSKQNIKLLDIFARTLSEAEKIDDFDLD